MKNTLYRWPWRGFAALLLVTLSLSQERSSVATTQGNPAKSRPNIFSCDVR